MKKYLAILLVLICILLSGCSGETETIVETPVPEVTKQPALSTEQPVAAPEMPAASPEPVTEEANPQQDYSKLAQTVQDIISKAETDAAELEKTMNSLVTQTDMNSLSHQIYMVWDDAINEIWTLFDENLERDLFYDIQAEQIAWITEKEKELQKIVDEYNGGSITALICNTKAAEMTEERIYELLEYVKS